MTHCLAKWRSLFELVTNIVRLSHGLTIYMLTRYTVVHTLDSQLSIGMGVNYSHSSVQQIFVLLLLTLDIKTSLNSDIALGGDVDLCEAPWTSLEPTSSSCYLRGEDVTLGNQMSWEAAQYCCAENGGYLVEIGSEEEQAMLTGRKGSLFLQIMISVESLYCSEASYIPASAPGLAAAQFTY